MIINVINVVITCYPVLDVNYLIFYSQSQCVDFSKFFLDEGGKRRKSNRISEPDLETERQTQ